jgi:tetratricopeptide (TPR) repeat protein
MLYVQTQAGRKSSLTGRITNVSLTGIAVFITVLSSPVFSEQNRVIGSEPEPTRSSPTRESLPNVEQLIHQAETAELNRKFDEAELIWRRIIQIQPNAVWASYSLGSILSRQEKYDDAIIIYRQIIQRYPQDSKAYYAMGQTLIARNKFTKAPISVSEKDLKQAIFAYGQGIELQPDRIDNLDWWSKVSPEGIVSAVRQELQSKANKTASDYLLLWSALRNLRRSQEAPAFTRQNNPALCQQFLDGCPDIGKSDPELEINALRQAIERFPKLAILYEMLGLSYYEQSEYSQAVTNFEQSIKLFPQNATAYYRLGDVLIAQNKLERAIKTFYQAVQVEPYKSWLDYRFWFPSIWFSTRQPRNKIIVALINELNQSPSATGYYLLGNILANVEDPVLRDKALVSYQNAIKLNPSFAKAYVRLGFILSTQKKSKEAEVAFRRAIQFAPAPEGAYKYLREMLRTQGRFDEAFQVFLAEQAATKEAQPNNPTVPDL